MSQEELKSNACDVARKLIRILNEIEDVIFVDDVLYAVSNNDEATLDNMIEW